MDHYEAVQVRLNPHLPALPILTPCCKGPAQVIASVHALRRRVAPATHRTGAPRLDICAHILLFNVCAFVHGILEGHSSNVFFPHSLPKDKIPIREGAVASLASILGGFGVVALFCSVGVNV